MFRCSKILFASSRKVSYLFFPLLALVSYQTGHSQELYPLSEPASSIPKNVLGVRTFSQSYKEYVQTRNVSYLRLMYGVTPQLSVYIAGIASNHHGEKYPEEFPFHNTPERGAVYPYKFNGVWAYAKYRFYSDDDFKQHFRLAAYSELSLVKTTHHETEPDLTYGDNSGLGMGLIATYLENKFAATLTLGVIIPFPHKGVAPDPIPSFPDVPEIVQYGKGLDYRMALGYRLLPFHYKNYKQGNLNLYVELHGKAYGAAKVRVFAGTEREYYLQNEQYPKALQAGAFLDFSPGIQYIHHSNLRIDFSTTFRFLGFSYARLYPVYSIGVQRYFYFGNKKNK